MNKSFTLAKLRGVEVAPDGPSLQPTASSLTAKWGDKVKAFGCPCAEDKRELWELVQKQRGWVGGGGA